MKRSIGFYTSGPPFEGDSLETGPLGGSETAFIEITRALAKLGHEVTAFNNCQVGAVHNDVKYFPFQQSLPILANKTFDIMVVSRSFGFFNLPIKATLKVLWNHDTLDNTAALRAVHDEIDLCLVLSRFHRDNFLTRLPQLDDRMVITRNGLNFELLDQHAKGITRNPHKLLYASRPERGLKILLEDIWPRLVQNRPDLKLYLCGYNVDQNNLDPRLPSLYDHLDLLIKKDPRIINLGPLPKAQYYHHLAESAMVVYPCTFPEISCLVALEAQAMGTPILTTDSYALTESVVANSFKVSGRPGSPDYIDNYVDRFFRLMNNPSDMKESALAARETIRKTYSWSKVAEEWQRLFSLNLKAKENRNILIETSESANHAFMV